METKAYAIVIHDFDFGILNARNQLISKVINPALDTLLTEPIWDHIRGSETSYTLTLHLKAEWEAPAPDLQ
jgi:hypothetical protein